MNITKKKKKKSNFYKFEGRGHDSLTVSSEKNKSIINPVVSNLKSLKQ